MTEMFTEDDLKQQQRLKCAFDPQHLLNPGKGLSSVADVLNLVACMFIEVAASDIRVLVL